MKAAPITESIKPAAPSMPMGFLTCTLVSIFGFSIPPTVTRANAAAAAHATGRHRRDGRWPSGNRRNRNVTMGMMPIAHAQLDAHATHTPPGRAPGLVTRAYLLYSSDTNPVPMANVVQSSSHPMALSGRREAISEPMYAMERKIRTKDAFWTTALRLTTARTMPPPTSATPRAKRPQAVRRAVPAFTTDRLPWPDSRAWVGSAEG